MTKEEVLAMEVGRELDTMVAREIMMDDWDEASPYSEDISAAWQVVEKLISMGEIPNLAPVIHNKQIDSWNCSLYSKRHFVIVGNGETAPCAICKAALLAKLEGAIL